MWARGRRIGLNPDPRLVVSGIDTRTTLGKGCGRVVEKVMRSAHVLKKIITKDDEGMTSWLASLRDTRSSYVSMSYL